MMEKIRAIAAYNAYEHEGKAELKAVVSRFLGLFPDKKASLSELMPLIKGAVEEINKLSKDEQLKIVQSVFPEWLEKKKVVEDKKLPDLPNVEIGKVVMRLAPSPSGPLHIGHARMAILNDEYVKRYKGKLILRIEDTNPANIMPEAYKMIEDDLKWLEVDYHEVVIQSDRFELYYDTMEKLISMEKAYVATTPTEVFKAKRQQSIPIDERNDSSEANLRRWEKMLNGDFKKGEAYAVIKTDLTHPNPAIRDFIAFRIIEIPHPLKGKKYRVYPMMNFSVAVDDHFLGLTHVIRGKDHLANTEKQKYIFNYFRWPLPFYLHYGKVSIENSILKTSIIKKGIANGDFTGWDDPRLGTLLAMKMRGINPRAIRRYWVETGIGDVDIKFSWENLYAFNKHIIDSESPRHFFVVNPIRLELLLDEVVKVKMPIFPKKENGLFREYEIKKGEIFIAQDDYNKFMGQEVRLKDLGNFKLERDKLKFIDNDLSKIKQGIPIIHWIQNDFVDYQIIKPDGATDKGILEKNALNYLGKVNQLERYGYANLINEKLGYYTHP